MELENQPKFNAQSWRNVSDTTQSLWVNVKQWDYKVFPTLHGVKFGDWIFQFGGVCSRNTPLKGLKVTGEIEILESDEIPGGEAALEEHWENVPEHVEGYGRLVSIGDKTVAPFVGITLYCKASAFDWIYRAFAAGAFGTRSGVGIEIKIDCPNNHGGDFWREQWRSEWWRVVSWGIYANTEFTIDVPYNTSKS